MKIQSVNLTLHPEVEQLLQEIQILTEHLKEKIATQPFLLAPREHDIVERRPARSEKIPEVRLMSPKVERNNA